MRSLLASSFAVATLLVAVVAFAEPSGAHAIVASPMKAAVAPPVARVALPAPSVKAPEPTHASEPPATITLKALDAPRPSVATPALRAVVAARTEARAAIADRAIVIRRVGYGVDREKNAAAERVEKATTDLGMKYAAAGTSAKPGEGKAGELAIQLRDKIKQRDSEKSRLAGQQTAAQDAAKAYSDAHSAASSRRGGTYADSRAAESDPAVQKALAASQQANQDKALTARGLQAIEQEIPSLARSVGAAVAASKTE